MKRWFAPSPVPVSASLGMLLVRLVAGAAMAVHGWGKIQDPFGWMGPDAGFPGWLLALAAVSEFGGGIAWMLGLLTRLASFGLACTMAVAVHLHAVVKGDPFVAMDGGSYESAALYLALALLFLLAGPGRLSADAVLFRGEPHG